MITLLLVRHGETESNRLERFRGLDDVGLSSRGLVQAVRLASAMSGRKLTALFTSPLLRARQTAEAIAQACGLPVQTEPALRDVDFGAWTGLGLEEVRMRWPQEWDVWLHRPQEAAFPGGESLEDVRLRVSSAIRRLAEQLSGLVALVSHRVILKLMVLEVLGLSPEAFWRIRIDTASITEVIWGEPPLLVRMNDVSHLGDAASGGRDF